MELLASLIATTLSVANNTNKKIRISENKFRGQQVQEKRISLHCKNVESRNVSVERKTIVVNIQRVKIMTRNRFIVLPLVPGLSPKLQKSFKNAGYKTMFKSSTNLKTLLASRNKSKLLVGDQRM